MCIFGYFLSISSLDKMAQFFFFVSQTSYGWMPSICTRAFFHQWSMVAHSNFPKKTFGCGWVMNFVVISIVWLLGILPHSGVGNCVPKKICMSDNICAHSTIIWLYQWPIMTHHHPWGLLKNIACPINGSHVIIGKCFYSVIHMILG